MPINFAPTRDASRELATKSSAELNAILLDLANATDTAIPSLLEANQRDLNRMDRANPMYDRLMLTEARLHAIAADLRHVADLPSPLGRELKHSVLPNGLELTRVSVPFGVIGIIFEARPNVCFDCFALCLKAGSACVLKGGSDAKDSCTAIVALIHDVLRRHGLPEATALLLTSHEATAELLNAHGDVDVIIPRGSSRLINFVRENAHVPVIETGAGVVNTYFDAAADLDKGRAIVLNAKTRRVSVCNALDCLIINRGRLADLPALVAPMAEKNVIIYADDEAHTALDGNYPLLQHATPEHFGTEFMDYKLAIRTVADLDEALDHIRRYGSGHSEAIVTEDAAAANRFLTEVDAACVYHNAPTSFTDGGQFGLGAEIGISTQKLHARGPMALEEITTYKWLIRGNGQTRA